MLLSLMRRHAKSYIIKFLIAIIALVFIFYFGYSFTSKEGIKIAIVNGELISEVEYRKAYMNLLESLQKEYKSFWSDNLIKTFDLKNRALENLIQEKLISQEARRVGLDVTEKEIQDWILSYPAFQFRGHFDEARYRAVLLNNRMKPEEFEAGIARQMLQRKVEQFIATFSPITDQEVKDYYTFSKERVKIGFIQFNPADYASSVRADESAMADYFKEHQERYRIPEKMKATYIVIDPDLFRDQVVVSDEQVKDFYEENLGIYKEKKQVKARHILFKLDQDASEEDEEKVKTRAQKVLEEIRKGGDFAALAKKYSEGPTREKGGDLGYFSEGQMVKEFEEAAFNIKKGEVSEPVKTPFGYHLIKVEDIKEARTKSLGEVREKIADTLGKTARSDLAHEKALSLLDQMPYDVDLEQYAAEQKVPVESTDYFSENEPIPTIGGDQRLRKSLFSLEKGDVSELIEINEKFYIIQIADKKASYLPELGDVKDKVRGDFVDYLARAEAKSTAEKVLEELKNGKEWKELSESHGKTPETTEFFTRSDPIPRIGHSPELQEASFSLRKDRPYPDAVYENQKGAFVIRWEGYEGIDEEAFKEEEAKYRTSMFRARHAAVMQEWLAHLKSRAEIEIINPVGD